MFAHDVPGSDVPVNEPGAVHSCQRSAEILPDEPGLACAERTVGIKHVLERHAADQFHPQADLPVMLAGTVNRYDIGMAHAREGAALVQEYGSKVLVLGL